MDIWQRGREEILDDLNKVFDRIGANLATKLDHKNSILIPRDELRDLRERAAKLDTLKDEVSSLARQKRAQDVRLSELEALEEKTAENEKLARENAGLKEQLEVHKAASSRVEELEEENKQLATQLRQILDQARDVATPARLLGSEGTGPHSSALRIGEDESGTVPREEWRSLVKKFNKLYDNHTAVKAARKYIHDQYDIKSEEARKLRKDFDSLEKDVKERDMKMQMQEIEIEELRSNNRAIETRAPLPMLLYGGANGGDEVVDMDIPEDDSHPTSSATSSTTEIKQEQLVETPMSPDTPIVVSSRSIRKRKDRSDAMVAITTPDVKIETITSSPVGLAALYGLDESMDLDDIGEKQSTPRKGRPTEEILRIRLQKPGHISSQSQTQSQLSRSSDSGHVSQATPTHRTNTSRKASALQPRSVNNQILPRTSIDRPTKKRRIASTKDIGSLLEDGQIAHSIERSPLTRNMVTPKHSRRLEDLLDKESPPKQALIVPARLTPVLPESRRSGEAPALSSRAHEVQRNDTPHTPAFFPHLTNGHNTSREPAELSRLVSREVVRRSAETLRPSSKGSIRSSLEPLNPPSRSTFRDSSYFSRPTSRDSPVGHLEASKSSTNTPRSTVNASRPSSKGQYTTPVAAPKSAQSRAKEQSADSSGGRKQPLRTRPLDELDLQDFKVNPNYNGGGGFGYAFNEVVRKKAERRCLQGCTKPECCGNQFRALAEATIDLNQSPTLSQEETDEKTLEEFLGDNSHKLRNMTIAERHETLVAARAREMSNRYGKHRHAFEGRTTPPGRWRADFPSTQEEIQDRAEAQRLDRDEVKKRYEAAMRHGGAYIFRDE